MRLCRCYFSLSLFFSSSFFWECILSLSLSIYIYIYIYIIDSQVDYVWELTVWLKLWTNCLLDNLPIERGRIVGSIPLPKVCERQADSFRIWTRVIKSISSDDKHYITSAYFHIYNQSLSLPNLFCSSCYHSVFFKAGCSDPVGSMKILRFRFNLIHMPF